MFTGIVEDLVKIEEIKKTGASKKTKIDGLEDKNRHDTEITINVEKMEKLKIGDSVAINGVCLTIAKLDKTMATFQSLMKPLKKAVSHPSKKETKST